MKNWIIAALVAVIAIGGAIGAFAATRTVDRVVEVRLWAHADDPSDNYISIRTQGGDWSETLPLAADDGDSSDGRFRYGDLTVVLPFSVSDADQAVLGTQQSSGHWSISRLYDAIYDVETVSAILGTDAVIDKVWTTAQYDDPYIQLYCRGDELQALIYWDQPIFAPVRHNPIPTIRSVAAVWRVDGSVPTSERWLPATHGMATFAQYPGDFISGILGGETLIFRVIPSNGEEHTLTVDVSGLADVMGNLTCYPR